MKGTNKKTVKLYRKDIRYLIQLVEDNWFGNINRSKKLAKDLKRQYDFTCVVSKKKKEYYV